MLVVDEYLHYKDVLNNMDNLYKDFLETLKNDLEKQALLMTHHPSSIRLASHFFDGYLTEEELQERQYAGRYWDLVEDNSSANGYDLFILLDNETILCVTRSKDNGKFVEGVYKRYDVTLPDSLRGRYYNF